MANTIRTLVVGNGGRESSLAWRLAEESRVHAVMGHVNPTIAGWCRRTNGDYLVGDFLNPALVAAFAKEKAIDLAVVANDSAQAAGVVDALLAAGIPTFGATQRAAEIEWNKVFARNLLQEHLPELNPRHWIVRTSHEVEQLFKDLERQQIPVVIKPRGLTGGKGVKVMGEHLPTYAEAAAYSNEILTEGIGGGGEVVIEERLEGVEFTVQAITDGKSFLRVPITYDFPYLLDGDKGPGTGGMGSFCGPGSQPPFVTSAEYESAMVAVGEVLGVLRSIGIQYTGVLNAGFFATPNGLRIMEFNARFGDPECMNIMCLLRTPFLEICRQVVERRLDSSAEHFAGEASVVKYLVSPDYPTGSAREHRFNMDVAAIEAKGLHVFFASSESDGVGYKTVGASRCVAVAAMAPSLQAASDLVEEAIHGNVRGALHHRKDIGDQAYIQRQARRRKLLTTDSPADDR